MPYYSKNSLFIYTGTLSRCSFQHPSQTVCVSFLLFTCPPLQSPLFPNWSPSRYLLEEAPSTDEHHTCFCHQKFLVVNTVNVEGNILSHCLEISIAQVHPCLTQNPIQKFRVERMSIHSNKT